MLRCILINPMQIYITNYITIKISTNFNFNVNHIYCLKILSRVPKQNLPCSLQFFLQKGIVLLIDQWHVLCIPYQ